MTLVTSSKSLELWALLTSCYKQLVTKKMLAGDDLDATKIYQQIMSQVSKASLNRWKFMDLDEDILGDAMKGLRGRVFSQLLLCRDA